MIHTLKTIPPFFDHVRNGDKTFELRKNDRPFKVGDTLVLQEYDPTKDEFTGCEEKRRITYILVDWTGLDRDFVILGLESILSD